MSYETAILIPHYNNITGLTKTLSSIESSHAVDLVIVDDGSSDIHIPSSEIINKVIKNIEYSLHLIILEDNNGVEYALNKGINFILNRLNSKFIFRIDSGDICLKSRLDIQLNYLKENDHICLVGSWVRYVDQNSKDLFVLKLPVTHNDIMKRMYVRVPFIHSAVLFRTSALKKVGMYTTEYKAAEDYAFFMKFVESCNTANIPEVLTEVEWNPNGISPSKRRIQLKSRLKLLMNNWKFSTYFIYGVLRVIALMIFPYWLVEILKKKVYK